MGVRIPDVAVIGDHIVRPDRYRFVASDFRAGIDAVVSADSQMPAKPHPCRILQMIVIFDGDTTISDGPCRSFRPGPAGENIALRNFDFPPVNDEADMFHPALSAQGQLRLVPDTYIHPFQGRSGRDDDRTA